VSYLADTVLLLRYFEVNGTVRQAMSVVKKRSGDHERTIREYKVQKGGLLVGEPLREFQGVLTGVPHYTGGSAPLLESNVDRDGHLTAQPGEAGNHAEDGVPEHGRQHSRNRSD
jgi:circadian clock protein KaiC